MRDEDYSTMKRLPLLHLLKENSQGQGVRGGEIGVQDGGGRRGEEAGVRIGYEEQSMRRRSWRPVGYKKEEEEQSRERGECTDLATASTAASTTASDDASARY